MEPEDLNSQRAQLVRAIAAQENLRGTLPDEIVDTTVAALRKQLDELEPAPAIDQQRKLATTLFVDVVDSTRLLSALDPEENLAIMDAALLQLAAPVAAHGGQVTRFMGDGFLAIFGLPHARENDPEMAVRAGLAILATAREIARQLAEDRQLPGFQVRIGANTGLVVTGGVTEAESTLMGTAVNLAARLESAAAPGSFLISEPTYNHVRGLFDVTPGEALHLRGFAEPVPVYTIKRARQQAFRLETRGLEGIQTRLIGRERELLTLQDEYHSVIQEGTARLVTIVGEAGIGKSRLLHEFSSWLALKSTPLTLLEGRAALDTLSLPFALLRNLFNAHFGIRENDLLPVVRQRIVANFQAALGPSKDSQLKARFVGQLLGYDFHDSPDLLGISANPRQFHDRALAYLVQYLQALAAKNPLVIFLDDLHWADESSLDTLDHLSLKLSRHPILLIALTRGVLFERRHGWGDVSFHQRLDLQPLSGQANQELVIEILQKIPEIPTTLTDMLVRKAEGNPYYLEELVRMLIAEGVIVKADPDWFVQPEKMVSMNIPPTLTGVIQARLDSLPASERLALQQASVVGRVFWDGAILAMADPGASAATGKDAFLDLLRQLHALKQRELIYPRETSMFSGTAEFTFKHMILRDVTYESILKRSRPRYHSAVAEWLITRSGERASELAGLIASHLELSGRKIEALNYFCDAAASAVAKHAVDEAANFYARALALVPAEDLETRYSLLLGSEFVFSLQGNRDAQRQRLDSLTKIAESLASEHKKAEVLLRRVWFNYYLGDYPEARAAAQQAVMLSEEGDAHDLSASAYYALAWIYVVQGDNQQAFIYARQALPLARQLGDRRAEGNTLNVLGMINLARSDYANAAHDLELFLNIAQEIGDREREMTALNNLGVVRTLLGSYTEAHASFFQILTLAREMGDRNSESSALLNLAWVAASASDWESALESGQRALAIKKESRQIEAVAEGLIWLGHAWLGLDQPDKAATAYREALQIRTELGQSHLGVEAIAGLARAALARQDLPAAQEHAAKLLEYIAADPHLSGSWEPLHVYFTCWQVLDEVSDPRAAEVLANGHALLTEQAARLPNEADRQLFLQNVPWHREICTRWSALQGQS